VSARNVERVKDERDVLEERARALARPQVSEARVEDALEVIVFALSRETYALETRFVREVARFTEVTPVPGAPPLLVGVTNLRGEILPVFDIRRLAGTLPAGLTDESRLLVIGDDRDEDGRDERDVIGLLADEVRDVVRLPRAAILEPPAALAGAGGAVLLGVRGDATIVLDGAGLLGDPRLFFTDSGRGKA
jgi:purine-binding chemotaxis protein CheW